MCCLSLQILVFMLRNITSVNVGAIITGVLCLGVLIGLKQVNERCRHRLKLPIPAELLVVMIFIVWVRIAEGPGRLQTAARIFIQRMFPKE